jgi:hypothetical protein
MRAVWKVVAAFAVLVATGCQVAVEPGDGVQQNEGVTGVVSQAIGPTAPIGNHEGIWANVSTSRYFTDGWTCDPDGWASPISMHFYMDGTYATGVIVGGVSANLLRPDVVNVCGGTTMHGWHWDIPDDPRWQYGTHSLYGYALNDNDVGPHPMLGSPSFTYYKISGNVGAASVTVSVGPRSAVSDASGNYTIYSLVPNTWTVTPSKSGCTFSPSSMAVTVAPDGLGKNFTINCGTSTYSISGNAGTASATLTATGGYSTTTGSSGDYTLSSLPTGTYTVTPSKSGCTFSPTSRTVSVGPNATAQSFTASCSGGWSGPTVTVTSDSERKKVRICPQGGGTCTEGVPLFLALNAQTNDVGSGNWSDFDTQLAAMDSHLYGIAGAVPIVEVHLLNTQTSFLNQLISHLNAMAHPPYLLVRWFIEAPSSELLRGVNMAGAYENQTLPDVNAAWIAAASTEIQNVLGHLDQNYQGKVVGFMPTFLTSGEWFLEPLAAGGIPAGGSSGLPWSAANMASFYYPTVTNAASSEFCAWNGLPSDLVTGCRVPTLAERNGGVANGSTLPNFVLDPTNLNSKRAAYFNQHQSIRIASAIRDLCSTAKTLTGNRILTVAFYGYMFGREWNLPASGHLGLKTLLASSSVDAIAAPLSYAWGRDTGQPFIPQGPMDSPNNSSKLWIHEDDTRTVLAPTSAGFKFADTVAKTNALLRRNAIATAIHGNGLYWLDLTGGWFGDAAYPTETDQIWDALADIVAQSNRVSTNVTNSLAPQIAVFVDDLSPAYMPAINPAGESTYDYANNKVYGGALDTIGRIGAPFRIYRLDDLQSASFPASTIKLAIFLNTFNVTTANRTAITNKLKVAGKTLLFIQGAGYLNGDVAPSVSNITSLTGITTNLGTGTLATLQIDPTITASANYGLEYPMTPWFYFDGTSTNLGSYIYDTAKPALAKKVFAVTGGSYTVIHSASPGLTGALYRQFASDAGVSLFTAVGDIVEARGNTLMVHVQTAGTRTVTLPFTPSQLYMNTGTGEVPCSPQSSCLTRYFNNDDVAVYRWQ